MIDLEAVYVCGTWRVIGAVSAEEREELERAHDAGDIRAEDRLRILFHGREDRTPPRLFAPPTPGASGTYSNVPGNGGIIKL